MAKKRRGVYARDVDRLNVIFAAVAIASLLSVVWMIYDDYAREWKGYQREFQVLEQEVTRQELSDAQAQVDQQRLTQLTDQRDRAEQGLEVQADAIGALEREIEDVGVRLALATQEFRFARSIYDARRWEYEEAAHDSDGDASRERTRMEEAERRVGESEALLEDLTTVELRLVGDLETLRADLAEAEAGLTEMNREIGRLQERLDALRFGLVYVIRNAPILDAFNPSERIQQAVLADLPMDLNFTTAPRVDRCQSCHLGSATEAFAEYQQPFRTHPRLDLFVADSSVHPIEQFGCTVCHFGKGRSTSFYSAVHTPSTESEEHRWEEEHGWAPVELWEWPMRPSFETEAGCLKCHVDDTWFPEAPTLEYGMNLVENLGCFACHLLTRFEDTRNTGPSLEHVAVKTTPEWAYNWVTDPRAFRPATPMPKFFNLSNTSDDIWPERNRVEVDAIVAYIFANSTEIELERAPRGNAETGAELVDSVGCLGCHIVDEPSTEGYPENQARFSGERQQGPNLFGVGSKVNEDWLYTWLKNPEHYWADTVMPNLRLTDREAADITAFLMSLRKPGWDEPTVPDVDADMRDEIVVEYLRAQLTAADAEARKDEMSEEEKRLYLGEQLIGRYGCYGCHTIAGFEERGRIGTDLSEWGSKPVPRLDFGLLDLPHERRPWLEQKLRDPRSYDEGKVRAPQEKFRMPNFQLTEEEIDAIATTMLGYTDEEIPVTMRPLQTPRRVAIEAGRALLDKYNCRGCHIIEDAGGALREVMAERGQAEGRTRAQAIALAPPNLRTQGAKVQPDWLYLFLREPTTIRPWLDVRMPTFRLSDEELNTLTQYFAAVDEAPFPFDERFSTPHQYPRNLVRIGENLASDDLLQCFRCHVRGSINPPGTPDTWAPDMAMAAERLRFEWLVDWIADPQSVMPGTRMPQFYTDLSAGSSPYYSQGFNRGDPILDQDPLRQIEALASYIMSLGQ